MGRLSLFIQVSYSNHGLLKAENLPWLQSEKDVMIHEGSRWCNIASFENVGRESRARNVSSLKSRKGKEMDSSIDTPERSYSLDDTLVLAQWDMVLDFWPTGYKIILFCCFKPLSLWSFVEAAIGNSCTSGAGGKLVSVPPHIRSTSLALRHLAWWDPYSLHHCLLSSSSGINWRERMK